MAGREEDGFVLDWREACALLGCSQSHFYNLVNAGLQVYLKTGNMTNSEGFFV